MDLRALASSTFASARFLLIVQSRIRLRLLTLPR